MLTVTEKEYKDIARKVGNEKMKTIEESSGVSTGLLGAPPDQQPEDIVAKIQALPPGDAKNKLLKEMRDKGCSVYDYNRAKNGEPNFIEHNPDEVMAQKEQIISLHADITTYQKKSFDNAIRIGEILFSMKEKNIKRRMLGKWMEQNLPFSIRTGQRYMQVYEHREELAKKNINNLADAYLELAGEPLPDEIVEVDDSTNTDGKWKIIATQVDVDNIKLPKKKVKGLKKTTEITQDLVDHMEAAKGQFDGAQGRYAKFVVNIPTKSESKILLSRFVIAVDKLLKRGGKLIFVKK